MARKKPPVSKSRFTVYRPEAKPDGPPNGKRFTVHVRKPPEPDAPPESGGSRFTIYKPKAPNVERYKPNGAAWIEHEGYWMCEYGCKTFRVREAPNGVDSDDYHAYNCPYWYEHGINETPF